jgi:hypothetical protein
LPGTAHTWVDGDVATAAYLNALPRGVMGYVLGSTSPQTGITTVADITGLTVTFTAVASRLYRTTLIVAATQLTAAGTSSYVIADAGNTQVNGFSISASTNFSLVAVVVLLETGISGSVTRKGRASTNAGTLTIEGAGGVRGSILVEDIGV